MKTLRVTTDAFKGDGGLDAFREIFGREILGIEIDPLDGHPLHIDLMLRSLPGFAMASGTLSPMRNRHTSALLDNDDVVLVVLQSGVGDVSQYGRVATISEGEAVLTANGAEATFTGRTSTRVINFRLSRNLLAPYVADIDALVARPISRDNRALQLMVGYAEMLNDQQELATPDLRRTVATHMHSLAALLLGGDAGLGQHEQGLRAARLRSIKDHVRDRVGHHALSHRRCRPQPADFGKLYSPVARGERHHFHGFRARRKIDARPSHADRSARYADRSISAVAYEAGFGDLSYFNRTFRRRYGATPSQMQGKTR